MIRPHGKGPICPKCKAHRMVAKNERADSGKIRWMCRPRVDGRSVFCYSTTDPSAPVRGPAGPVVEPVFKRPLGKTRRLIITAAQNATPVDEKFFGSLLTYARVNKAELLVIPLRYRNPTSQFTPKDQKDDWWAPELEPYLWNQRKRVNENLQLMADIKIQAATSDPLTQFESISGPESGIFGHTKLQQRTIPVPKNKLPKILTTTGACTLPNYTDTKRGKIGEFHHATAAVIVEVSGKSFHMRHVVATNGEFNDLNTHYSPSGATKAPRPLAVVLGDTHVDFVDPAVEKATFGKGGIVDTLDPQVLVFHDLIDNYAINPHHVGNPFNAVAKRRAGRDSVAAEVERAISYVARRASAARPAVVVSSNHDDFLRRWIVKADWKEDAENAETYLSIALEMVEQTRLGPSGTDTPSPFRMLIRGTPHVRSLGLHESLVLGGVELGMHGEIGPNGARGSIKNLRRIGTRSIIGHSHTPGIEEGCYQVGTSTRLRLEYNLGPSSWLNTHCVLHADGKRQLINIINGKWRLQ